MNQGKKAMKILVIFMLSLTLTGGYAQAYPDLYNLGFQSRTTPSINDFLSSNLFSIFGNSRFWDFSKPDVSSLNYISRDEAIEIAKSLWPGIILTKPARVQKFGGVWIVMLNGCTDCNCPADIYCAGTAAGGTAKISATTGEIISVSRYK